MSRNPIPPRVPPRQAPPAAAQPEPSPQSPTARPAVPSSATDVIIARGATYYRMTRYIMIVLLVGMGAYFAYDGYKGWPVENRKIADLNAQLDAAKKRGDTEAQDKLIANELTAKPPHSDKDILLQKFLGFALPAGALAMLIWALYRSRGEYRLSGETLSAPGHPPVALSDIVEIDKSKWDRKGIARLTYKKPAGPGGTIVLDDFIYDRDPIDEIYKRIEARFNPVSS